MTSRIRTARRDREWSQTRLIAELQRVALRRGIALPSLETLKSRVSRWENGHATPDEFYRQLLREALGMDDRELGFEIKVDEPLAAAADELQLRLTLAKAPDGSLLDALRSQTEAIRVEDREFGAGLLLEQMRGHVRNLETHLSHTVFDTSRRPLARILADASALAGWQALDVGGVDQAWRSFEVSTAASRQAADPSLYAFARLEQAHVLTDLALPGPAADLAEATWAEVEEGVTPSVRCWMAAATAEMLAADDRRDDALRMIFEAETRADRIHDERPSYLVFNETHLRRWIGHTLVQLEDPAAEQLLREVLAEMDASFIRASASLTLDLASAVLMRDERSEGSALLGKGEALARKVGSRRQLLRAQKLRAAS